MLERARREKEFIFMEKCLEEGMRWNPLTNKNGELVPIYKHYYDIFERQYAEQICYWYCERKAAGVRINGFGLMSLDSEFIMIDIDQPNVFGFLFDKSPRKLAEETYVVRTKSGGYHVIYICPDEYKNLTIKPSSHNPFVEIYTSGRYFVAPPTPNYVFLGTRKKEERIFGEMRNAERIIECAKRLLEKSRAREKKQNNKRNIREFREARILARENFLLSLEKILCPRYLSILREVQEKGIMSHRDRFDFAVLMINLGYSDEEMHKVFSLLNDYKKEVTQYQIDQIRLKNYCAPSNCKSVQCPLLEICKFKNPFVHCKLFSK